MSGDQPMLTVMENHTRSSLLRMRSAGSWPKMRKRADLFWAIGKQRIAFDFTSRVTRLPELTGEVLPMKGRTGNTRSNPGVPARFVATLVSGLTLPRRRVLASRFSPSEGTHEY